MADPTQVPVQVQGVQPGFINVDQLHREYGETMVQFKIVQSKINILEQQIQAYLNQQAPQTLQGMPHK